MWQLNQLERLHEIDPEFVNSVVNKFLEREYELLEKLVIGAYLDDEINLGKAAELLKIHPIKLRKKFLSNGIPVKIGIESKEAIIAEEVAA